MAELPRGSGAYIYCNDNNIFEGKLGILGEASTPHIP